MEKEFHYSRYITIRRKAELANNVGLSERQVSLDAERLDDSEKRRQKSNVCVIAGCFCSHMTGHS